MAKIKDIPKIDRPREKFLKKGADALSKSDLLAILLGSGIKGKNVRQLSEQIIKKFGKNFINISIDDLLNISGIGQVKALQIISAISLIKRFYEEEKGNDIIIKNSQDALSLVYDLRDKKKEYLICFYLNARNVLIKKEVISIGLVDKSLLHPREIFHPAIELNSTGIILVHNHPSGNPNPSIRDTEVVKKIIQAGELIGIPVIDFLITASGGNYSFFQELRGQNTDFNYVSDEIQASLFDFLDDGKTAYEINIEGQGFQSTPFISIKKQLKIRYEIDEIINKVHCGDCIEVMQQIPDKSIDMILCDLPYGTTRNQWDSIIPLDKLWQQYERIIKDNGAIILTSQGVFTAKLILSNEKLFKYKIVWEKSKPTNFLNAKKQPLRKHEDICVFYKNQPQYNPQMIKREAYNKGIRKDQLTGSYGDFKPVEVKSNGDRYPIDVVYFKTAESEGSVYHPTQKPVALGQYLIRTYTKPGDIVLDNACGSGSFLLSAVLEDRNFIGIEKNEDVHLFKDKKIDYIAICNKRIADAKADIIFQSENHDKNII
jgi:DNA repair protein RadC